MTENIDLIRTNDMEYIRNYTIRLELSNSKVKVVEKNFLLLFALYIALLKEFIVNSIYYKRKVKKIIDFKII